MVLLTSASAIAAQSVVPAAYPSSRYAKLKSASPFALETPVAAPEAPKDSFTKDWVLTALNNEPDAQGVDRPIVSIMTRDQTQRIYLFGNEPNKDGIAIASVERSPVTGKSKVTLKKGNEFGTVEYDQMLIQSAGGQDRNITPQGPGGQRQPRIPIPGGPPPLNPMKQPAGRPVIPRPTLPQAKNGAAPYPSAAPAPTNGDARRRIRVINSKP
ncbi:MAG: hypothetical protein EOP84_08615 [Verrucomicrobiaceae bacterium]|nr:MAG: hypothetical protein EOP84_08615 [Verrucomicrobiaceae bacterium]